MDSATPKYPQKIGITGHPISTLSIDDNGDETVETWRTMKEWLDKQEKGSDLYVPFGIEAKLRQ